MNRRRLLGSAAATVAVPLLTGRAQSTEAAALTTFRRLRPGDAAWPSTRDWSRLAQDVGDRLFRPRSPLPHCAAAPTAESCGKLFKALKNPYLIGDDPALTQTLGWAGAWKSEASAYAVAAETTQDVVAAVNFARKHRLRLVVKGGGHSYQGTSNAADSLLVWTRRLHGIELREGFTASGCGHVQPPQPAVTIGAGAIWNQAYAAVTTHGGRYVQGGGCMTVGVAGLIQSGGFGSFSKRYGLAAAGLLEAEVVTADGAVRIANRCTNPDLFWAVKGGGGGTFGVVTRLTLRTRELPNFLGGVTANIHATSDAAYRRLIGKLVGFYADQLFNPHWGEQLFFLPGDTIWIRMTVQGMTREQVEQVWRPFFAWIEDNPADFEMKPPVIRSIVARDFWNDQVLKAMPGTVVSDDRPGAPQSNLVWAGDLEEAGHYLHGFQSLWLHQALLDPDQQPRLCDALFKATRSWWISLQVNKGLAGAPAEEIAAARDTAINPVVLDAFALAISGSAEQPAYPGVAGHEPDLAAAGVHAAAIQSAMGALRQITPGEGAYLSESNFFQPNWRQAFWGSNYERLAAVKAAYDPEGLFFVHHGVGSDAWSADGFQRLL